jgi:ParB family chromosome partitioning protein
MESIVSVNPFRCRMWSLHDRIGEHVTAETCRDEIESFLKHGQLVPALGRSIHDDADYEVELIYGARRLFVAQHLNKPLKVELREGLSDREAIVAMDIENRQRTDVSAYERGVAYARWLNAGRFKSQEDIARALKISASQVSRLLNLSRLPAVVVDAFGNPLCIYEGWGVEIVQALDDPTKRDITLTVARAIAAKSPRPSARDVYRQLLAAPVRGRKPRATTRDEVVRDRRGDPLFRIRHQSDSIALLLPRNRTSARSLDHIRDFIAVALQGTTLQTGEWIRDEGVFQPRTGTGDV